MSSYNKYMMGYIESLDNLGFAMSDELAMNVIL
jgi:hypothetical protein